jgi:hypothetical protein
MQSILRRPFPISSFADPLCVMRLGGESSLSLIRRGDSAMDSPIKSASDE